MNLKRLTESKLMLGLIALFALAALFFGLMNSQSSGTASEAEKRIAEVLGSIDGAGKVEVALFYEPNGSYGQSGKPIGAVVVAQGAGDIVVRLNLIRALRTLLGLSETAVDVFTMEEEQR